MPLAVTHWTDPACPFAFSAEPVWWRLRWHYGDRLAWTVRMIALTLEPGEAERLAEGAPNLQRIHGMPIDPAPYPRPASSEPACRAVVAVREHEPGRVHAFLRQLRVRVMTGGLVDDPELILAAAHAAGVEASVLDRDVDEQLRRDIEGARSPAAAARLLDHKLGGPRGERRYTAPSVELGDFFVPGFNPVEVYETALANLGLERRARPERVEELLAWADEPLATAEVALVMRLHPRDARAALGKVARPAPAGADFYWSLA